VSAHRVRIYPSTHYEQPERLKGGKERRDEKKLVRKGSTTKGDVNGKSIPDERNPVIFS